MENEKVIKVFHAARQDIEIVYHLGGLIPHPVFDTQVAAMVCGFGEFDQLRPARPEAHRRRASTSRRASPTGAAGRCRTARSNTRWPTSPISATSTRRSPQRLDEQNRTDWVREEMEVLTSPGTYRLEPEEAWKRLKLQGAQADRACRPARGGGLARARGAGARRAARPRHQGRRHLRDRRAAADDRRRRSASCAPSRAASSARARPKTSSPRCARPWPFRATSCRAFPSTGRRPTATAPRSTCSRCCSR